MRILCIEASAFTFVRLAQQFINYDWRFAADCVTRNKCPQPLTSPCPAPTPLWEQHYNMIIFFFLYFMRRFLLCCGHYGWQRAFIMKSLDWWPHISQRCGDERNIRELKLRQANTAIWIPFMKRGAERKWFTIRHLFINIQFVVDWRLNWLTCWLTEVASMSNWLISLKVIDALPDWVIQSGAM